MAQSPKSPSAPNSGAAKDDVLGANGVFKFTIDDLLANDRAVLRKSIRQRSSFSERPPTKAQQVRPLIWRSTRSLTITTVASRSEQVPPTSSTWCRLATREHGRSLT